ncbi:MAG: prepilin peptidase [Betaproteobacteria bacterium]|nr:prepilin peptidase [Betaproteobacteria bacterium]
MNILHLVQTTPTLFVSICVVLGLIVGSFLNVVIYRLPRMMQHDWQAQCAELRGDPIPDAQPFNLVVPRSACPACGHRITALENVPLVSYLALKGRCSACRSPISPRYPIVEAASGLLTGFIAWNYGFTPAAFAAMVFAWAMIALTAIDLDTQLLPDSVTLPLLWAGLLINLSGIFTDLRSAVIGAVAGYLILWSVYWLFKLVTGKEGMGYGDFKLLAAIGAWLGWKMLPLVILLSSAVGALVGIGLMVLARHGRNVPIPFGPYLAGGGLIALFWGEAILRAYLDWQ